MSLSMCFLLGNGSSPALPGSLGFFNPSGPFLLLLFPRDGQTQGYAWYGPPSAGKPVDLACPWTSMSPSEFPSADLGGARFDFDLYSVTGGAVGPARAGDPAANPDGLLVPVLPGRRAVHPEPERSRRSAVPRLSLDRREAHVDGRQARRPDGSRRTAEVRRADLPDQARIEMRDDVRKHDVDAVTGVGYGRRSSRSGCEHVP